MRAAWACVIAACGWICLAAGAADASGPPNIVFVLADDLGVHDLGSYGRSDHRTPHLDRLATEGQRYTTAYCAQPICSASRAALLTGLAPARLHLTTFLPGRPDTASQRVRHPVIEPALPLARVTLAERLTAAGYATACIGKWHLGDGSFGPEHQGFGFVYAGKANTPPSPTEGSKGEFDLTRQAIGFIERHRDQPFFLYLAHNSPHIPYSARPDLVERHHDAFEPAYAAVVESLDGAVGELLDALDRLGLRENTLVVFTSDNGGLHVPELRHDRVTHNGPFRAGKGYLYEGGLRVPLLVRWPNHVPAGQIVDTPFVNVDWVPTLLELVGRSVPRDLDGRSLAHVVTGHGRAPERALYWHFPHYTNQGGRPGGAVREGRWKLIEFYDTGTAELYDLVADPGEHHDMAASNPRRVRRLRADLGHWRATVSAQSNAPNPACDEARFRALYVDVDPSRFDPAHASPAAWTKIATWRQEMDRAVADRP